MEKKTIRQWRRLYEYSQTELGDHLKVSKQTIFNWENGLHKPNKKYQVLMGELFGVEVEQIIIKKGEKNENRN